MEYKNKYLKYKTKYLELKNNEIHNIQDFSDDISIGGAKDIIQSNDNMKLIPKKSVSSNFIELEYPDIIVSQCEYREGPVGLTFIRFKGKGAKVHMEVRGGWPAYINSLSTNEKHYCNGINIAGGSFFGLESTTGIIAETLKSFNYEKWLPYNGSIIYSQNLWKNKIYPDKELGRFAFKQRDKFLYNGQVGAGLSASHGQGWGYKKIMFDGSEVQILALVVNNAVGSVYNNDKIVHNPSGKDEALFPMVDERKSTTIIVVMTTLELDNDELKQMNQQLNVTIGENIRPFNTFLDGDTFYTCSTNKVSKKYNDWNRIEFFVQCSAVLKEAILNSIK